jgi:hypothetical protein
MKETYLSVSKSRRNGNESASTHNSAANTGIIEVSVTRKNEQKISIGI